MHTKEEFNVYFLLFLVFLNFIYFEREREHVSWGGAERERERERERENPQQSPHYQYKAQCGAQTHET